MRTLINKVDPSTSIVDENGKPTAQMQVFFLQVQQQGLLIGQSTPFNTLIAPQGSFYMDETAAPGSILWVKQVDNIGGDKTKGWIALG